MNINVEAEGINELINEILSATEGIDDVTSMLTGIAIDIQQQLRNGRFNDQSGNLRRSMRAFVSDNSLVIRMLYYGYYLYFGTRETNRSPLTAEVASVFSGKNEGSFFKQPDNNRGIAARRFYPTDIQELIAERLEAIALENLEE